MLMHRVEILYNHASTKRFQKRVTQAPVRSQLLTHDSTEPPPCLKQMCNSLDSLRGIPCSIRNFLQALASLPLCSRSQLVQVEVKLYVPPRKEIVHSDRSSLLLNEHFQTATADSSSIMHSTSSPTPLSPSC